MLVTHLEFLQLLQDHVVRHVVKEPIGGGEDDVTQLDVKGGAVCSIRTVGVQTIKSNRKHLCETDQTINTAFLPLRE